MGTTATPETAAPVEPGPEAWLAQQSDQHPWEALRAPFADDEIAYKPQPVSKDIRTRGTCAAGQKVKHGESMIPVSRDGIFCGGFHAPSVHLTYVGHAALCERLDSVCGPENWNWEPFAVGPDGLPAIKDGSLWIRLTIWGVTKIGVGDHEGQAGPVAHKVMVGDALRNAGMRFGIARYLWDKSEKAREQARQERGDDEPAPRRAELSTSKPAEDDPFQVRPLTEAGKELVGLALAADDDETLRQLYVKAQGLAEQHVTPAFLGPCAQVLNIERHPFTLVSFVERVQQFVTHFRISPVVAVEQAQQKAQSTGGAEQ